MTTYVGRIQLLAKTAPDWQAADPVLLLGEIGAADVGSMVPSLKIGDGLRNYSQLPNLMAPVIAANDYVAGPTTTLPAGSQATVVIDNTVDPPTISFGIPRGNTGATGPANTLTVGTVTTTPPGSPAVVTITGTAPNQVINFSLPQGQTGPTGATGNTGATGPPNVLTVGTVTTGAPGSAAVVTITGTSPAQTINFTIPTGAQGPKGDTGEQGPAGNAGTILVDDSHVTGDWLFDATTFFGFTTTEVAQIKASGGNVGYEGPPDDSTWHQGRVKLARTSSPFLRFLAMKGGYAAAAAVAMTTNEPLGYLQWAGASGPNSPPGYGAQIVVSATAPWTPTSAPGVMSLRATPAGATLPQNVLDLYADQVQSQVEIRSRGAARFGGWYNVPGAADVNGPAAEIGHSAGISYVLSYNRTASTYHTLAFQGLVINLAASGAATPALQITTSNACAFRADVWHGDSAGTARLHYSVAASYFASPTGTYNFRRAAGEADHIELTGGGGHATIRANADGGGTAQIHLHQTGIIRWCIINQPTNGNLLFTNASATLVTFGTDGGITTAGSVAVRAGNVYLGPSDKRALSAPAGDWLYLNQDSSFTSGVYSPGIIRSGTSLLAGVSVDSSDQAKRIIWNSGGLSYGTAYITGTQGGYHGLAVYDGTVNPTLMSSGSAAGIYNQGDGKWAIYRSTAAQAYCEYALSVSGTMTAPAFNSTSSRAIKRETGTPTNAHQIIAKLRPILYRLIDGDDSEQLGAIAEEVHAVCPWLSRDGKTVAYDRFGVLLLAALQQMGFFGGVPQDVVRG